MAVFCIICAASFHKTGNRRQLFSASSRPLVPLLTTYASLICGQDALPSDGKLCRPCHRRLERILRLKEDLKKSEELIQLLRCAEASHMTLEMLVQWQKHTLHRDIQLMLVHFVKNSWFRSYGVICLHRMPPTTLKPQTTETKGSPVSNVSVHRNESTVHKKNKLGSQSHHYKLTRVYYRHSSSLDFTRKITTVNGKHVCIK